VQIEFIDERIDDPHRVVLGDEVVQRLGQQRDLVPVLAFDEPWHIDSCFSICFELYAVTSNRGPGFSHSLVLHSMPIVEKDCRNAGSPAPLGCMLPTNRGGDHRCDVRVEANLTLLDSRSDKRPALLPR
jgi:hypothetical protein